MHNFPLQINFTNYINITFCIKTACDEKCFFQTHKIMLLKIEFLEKKSAYISSNIIYNI